MKIIREIPIEKLSFKEALHDETLFALSCHRQSKKGYDENAHYDGEEMDELRCSCRPLCMMTVKSLRKLFDNPKEFLIIQIDPEG